MSDLSHATVGFIGAGSMGGAIARGLVAAKALPGAQVLACDSDAARLAGLAEDFGMRTFTSANEMLAQGPTVVVLAVKPQVQPAVLQQE